MRMACFIVSVLISTFVWGEDAVEKPLAEQHVRQSPDWIRNGVIYQINLRSFTPSGTLREAAGKLPKVAEAGATVVYLMPVTVSDGDMDTQYWSERQKTSGTNNPKNPYRTKDYENVDPEYGTVDDLKYFVKTAHALNLRVLLDLVYYHCGPTAKIADAEKYPGFVKRDENGKFLLGKWPFPTLNHDNPAVREYLWNNMEWWVRELDVDGFRLDISGTISLDFWEEARRRLEKIRPDIGMLSEGTRPKDQLFAFDVNYIDFYTVDRVFLGEISPVEFVKKWEKYAAERPIGFRSIRFFNNHDMANDDKDNNAEKRYGFDRANAALVLCFTMDGVPFLYNGQEFADTNRQSLLGWFKMDWNQRDTSQGKERLALCRTLSDLHRQHAAFDGSLTWLENSQPQSVLSFRRQSANETLYVLINVTDQPVTGTFARCGSAILQKGTCQNGTFQLPPFGYVVLQPEGN